MNTRLLIGTDEAGYGPNLGPLVITATAWQLPAEVEPTQLWSEFDHCITNERRATDRRLLIADSKQVYSSGDGLEDLEVAVLAFLHTLDHSPQNLESLGRILAGSDFGTSYRDEPWNATSDVTLPADSSEDHIREWSGVLKSEMQKTQIRFLSARSRIVFPAEFNDLVQQTDSKGVVLSNATMQLVRQLTDDFPNHAATSVVCDKHGGRNRYDELIASHFDDQFVFRVQESRERSRYRCGTLDFCFRTKAEELLPVALASMTAKYLRELLMRQFNLWWQSQQSGLKPTQGYPVDAARFRSDVEDVLDRLQISERVFWRCR